MPEINITYNKPFTMDDMPNYGDTIWTFDLNGDIDYHTWKNTNEQVSKLNNGLLFKTSYDATAAQNLIISAMSSFNTK